MIPKEVQNKMKALKVAQSNEQVWRCPACQVIITRPKGAHGVVYCPWCLMRTGEQLLCKKIRKR